MEWQGWGGRERVSFGFRKKKKKMGDIYWELIGVGFLLLNLPQYADWAGNVSECRRGACLFSVGL